MKETIDYVDVLKVGTSVLVKKQQDGTRGLDWDMFQRIGRQASGRGNKVLVSSAAITAGLLAVNGEREIRRGNEYFTNNGLLYHQSRIHRPTEMHELQRLASIGWRHIHNAWDANIPHKTTGALLLTRQELSQKEERNEALRVIHTLLSHNEVPIINENDSITHEEICFGDNDTLAATLAVSMAQSELFGKCVRLFLISDVNGVYADRRDPSTRIPVIENTDDFRHVAFDTDSEFSASGMLGKFAAADIANAGGVDMWIYNGMQHANYAVRGQCGTYFPAK